MLKVGDRIRVFEVQPGHYAPELIGKHSAEKIDDYFGNPYGVTLCYQFSTSSGLINYNANIDNDIVEINHVKHVATMVITKLKQ